MSVEIDLENVGEGREDDYILEKGSRIIDLLEELDRNPEEYVVKRNEKIVSEREELEDGDSVVIVPVVSGG